MTVTLMKNSSYSISKIKSELKKYCYVNASTSYEQERKRIEIQSLIDDCMDEDLLRVIFYIFDNCIRCYFADYRTEFNKIRSLFMYSVMNTLLVKDNYKSFVKTVELSYDTWCECSYIDYNEDCLILKRKAKTYLKTIQ